MTSEQKPVLIWAADVSGLMAAYLCASQGQAVALFCENDLMSVGSEFLSDSTLTSNNLELALAQLQKNSFTSFYENSTQGVLEFANSFYEWFNNQLPSSSPLRSAQVSAQNLLDSASPLQWHTHSHAPVELLLQRLLVQKIYELQQQHRIDVYENWLWIKPILSDQKNAVQGVVACKKQSSEFYVFKSQSVITAGESYHEIWSQHLQKSYSQTGAFLSQVYQTRRVPLAQMEFVSWSSPSKHDSAEALWQKSLFNQKPVLQSGEWSVVQTYGGLYVDDFYQTPVKGLYALGSSTSRSRGDLSSLAWSFLQKVSSASTAVGRLLKNTTHFDFEATHQVHCCEEALQQVKEEFEDIIDLSGPQNIFKLQNEFNAVVQKHVQPGWDESQINYVLDEIYRMRALLEKVGLSEKGRCFNQEYVAFLSLRSQFELLEAHAISALVRQESRAWSLRKDFPERDDSRYKKQTRLFYNQEEPHVSLADPDISFVNKNKERA